MPHPAAMNLGDVRKPIITYSLNTKKTQKRMTVWKIIPQLPQNKTAQQGECCAVEAGSRLSMVSMSAWRAGDMPQSGDVFGQISEVEVGLFERII